MALEFYFRGVVAMRFIREHHPYVRTIYYHCTDNLDRTLCTANFNYLGTNSYVVLLIHILNVPFTVLKGVTDHYAYYQW